MAYILNISTAVPEYSIEKEDIERFYSQVFGATHPASFFHKINILNKRTKINKRYSCIPDYNGHRSELYTDGTYKETVEKRMEVYKKKILPLAAKAIDGLLIENNVRAQDITHLITVSCTGLFAPGFEFLVAEHYGLQQVEKTAINYMGCYAAIKALKQANYIATADPAACVLIVCAELCSLHYYPADTDEDLVANLLFSDGAAATLVCGTENKHARNQVVLNIDAVGSAYIPGTLDLMTWDISSTAFRMYLSRRIVEAIKNNIQPVLAGFLNGASTADSHWAIHPGGVKIVEAVRDALGLDDTDVADSMNILQNYGNMSSPTILFILKRIFDKIKENDQPDPKKIVSCAFGPGINIEMMSFACIDTSPVATFNPTHHQHVAQV